jgi:hypothetical protein
MRPFIKIFLLLILILTSACTPRGNGSLAPDAPLDAVPSLEGDYVVNGFDPLGTEYSGVLTIFATDKPGEYTMQWVIVGSIQEGKGKLDGNTLRVEWESLDEVGGGMHGTSTYTVTVAGELYGTRTVDGQTEKGTETAYPNQ